MAEENEAVNEVDTSPEKIAAEWEQIAIDESINLSQAVSDTPEGITENTPEVDRSGAAEKIAGYLVYGFKYGFNIFAPALQATKDECVNLAIVWSKVIAKYTPAKWLDYLPDSNGGECVECDAIEYTLGFAMLRTDEGKALVAAESQQEISTQANNATSENNSETFVPLKTKSELEAEKNKL